MRVGTNWVVFDLPFTHHKHLELEAWTHERPDRHFRVSFDSKGDHAGLRIHGQLGRFMVGFTVYDDRHWDYENDRFTAKEKKK